MIDIAILCEHCLASGDFGSMRPGRSGHDDAPVFGIAEITVADDWERDATWLATGMTAAQAQERLDRTEFDEPARLLG